MNHQVPPTAVDRPLQTPRISPVVLFFARPATWSGYKYEQSSTESSCCCCSFFATGATKFGPCSVESPTLHMNQLNQQSLIPADLDWFIKGLVGGSTCFLQSNHFPPSGVTQKQELEIFPHPLPCYSDTFKPQSHPHCNYTEIHMAHTLADKRLISMELYRYKSLL